MRKNFTQLITRFLSAKRYSVPGGAFLLFLATSLYVWATIFPTPVNHSATVDQAADGASPAFVSIGNVVINEEGGRDFTATSLVFRTSGNWRFNPNSATTVALRSSGGNLSSAATIRPTISADFKTLTFPITYDNGGNNIESFTISGLQVQPLSGAVALPSAGTVFIAANSSVAGLGSNRTIANLSMTHGAASQLTFTTQPGNGLTNAALNPQPVVVIQDKRGNTVTTGASATSEITLEIGNNPGGGVLNGTKKIAASNGVVTFSDLAMDAAGAGYTLVASSGVLATATSNTFTINSTQPVLAPIAENICISVGAPSQEITLTGSNFARNAIARVNGNHRATTFVSSTELRILLETKDLAAAGGKTISVVNPGPTNSVSGDQILMVRGTVESVTIRGNRDVCTGQIVTYSGPETITDYEWSVTEGASVISETANSYRIRFDDIAPTSGIVTITVSAKNPCGIVGTQSFDVIVKQSPPAEIKYDTPLIFCQGGSVELKAPVAPEGEPGYSYQWRLGATEVGANLPTFTASEAGNYTVIITAENGCPKTSPAVTVSVTTPLTQGPLTGITAFCQYASATALTATVSGGVSAKAYLWEQSNEATGSWEAAEGTNNTASYRPSTDAVGTMYYRRTVTSGNCTSVGEPIAVTVTPAIANNTITGTQTVCSGGAIALLDGAAASGDTSLDYLWQESTDGTNWDAAAGTNNQEDYQPATQTVLNNLTTYYRRTVTSGNCTSYSENAIVTITAMPVATVLEGTNAYFCYPGEAVLTAQSGTGYTYQWYRVIEGGDDVEVGRGRVINVGRVGDAPAIDQYYVVVSQETNGNSCSTRSASITVEETIVGNNIINSQDQVVCYGATPEQLEGSTATSSVGQLSYQWQVSTNGTSFANITGATDVNLPLGSHTADRWYRRIARVSSCINVSTETIHVAVLPQISNPLTSGNQTICLDNPAQPISGAVTGGKGSESYAYIWYQKTGNGDWQEAPGANNAETYTPQVSATAGTYSFRRDVVSGSCAPVQSNVVTVTVQPAIAGNTIGGTDSYCLNATSTNLATTGAGLRGGSGTNYTYSWQMREGTGGSWEPVPGATAPTYKPVTTEAGEFYYKRIVTSGSCTGTESNEFKVTILPAITNTLSGPSSYSYCQYTTASVIEGTVSGGNGNYTYAWQQSTTGIGSWTAASGTTINQATYTPPVTAAGTMYYRRTVTSGVCATPVASSVITVTVIPAIANNNITSGPSSVCFGSQPGQLNGSTPTNGGGAYTYLWEQSTNGGTTWADAVGANNQQNYQPPVLTATTQYRRTVSAGTCIPSVSATHTITVTPLPAKPSITNLAASYFTGDAAVAMRVSPAGATGGSFTVKNAAGQTVSTSATFTPCTLGAGTYTVTYTYTSGGCSNTSEPITVTINQSTYKAVVISSMKPFCQGDNVTHTVTVWRDATVIYPYLTNEDGDPVRADGSLVGPQELPVTNPNYEFPANTPDVIKQYAFRYFNPIVKNGLEVKDGITYQWTKNQQNESFANTKSIGNAGLSSLDYYAVYVTVGGGSCGPNFTRRISSRTYTAEQANYNITLSAEPSSICQGAPVTFTASLDENFPWSTSNLVLNWMVNGVVMATTNFTTQGAAALTFTTTGPAGGFKNGDQVTVDFNTDIEEFDKTSKCRDRSNSNLIEMDVNDIALAPNPTQQNLVICLNGSATFNAPVTTTGSATETYIWTVGTKTYTSAEPGFNVPAEVTSVAGSYPVSVEVSNSCETTSTLELGTLTVKPALTSFTVSGGGSYCAGTIGTFLILLSGSEEGVNYSLWRDGVWEQTLSGTGGALEFTAPNEAGTYLIRAAYATDPLCSVKMTGSATITETPVTEVVDASLQVVWNDESKTWTVTALESDPEGAFNYDFGSEPIRYTWYRRESLSTDISGDWGRFVQDGPSNIYTENAPGDNVQIKVEIFNPETCTLYRLHNIGVQVLPVEIIYLTANRQGNDVLLEWATAMEQDNAGFEVQVSNDGFNYRVLAFVPTRNGNTSIKQTYAFTDREAGKHGTRYYRLKQVDTNGTFEFFGPKAVSFGGVAGKVLAYPNPFHDEVTLDIAAEQAGELVLVLTDAAGRQLLERRVAVEQGFTTQKLRLEAGLPRGLYILRAHLGGQTQYLKLVKE